MRIVGGWVVVACMCTLLSFGAGAAQADQIVYQHGQEIWAMNDDGSSQHSLLNASQVPGMSSIGDPSVSPNGGASLAFDATTLIYAAPVGSGPAGACGINCTGVYTLAGGGVTRISAAPAPCGAPSWCGSFDLTPHWTADGNLAYEDDIYAWEFSCFGFCSWQYSDSVFEINVVAPSAGAGVGTTWNMQFHPLTIDGRPDPADPGKLSYVGSASCSPECMSPLYVSTGNGTDTPVVFDDNLIEAAWSPDGSQFADIEAGGERGIWTYASNEAKTPGKKFTWALEDPIQKGKDPGENPFDVTFKDVNWIGTSKIVFSADDNLWTIPTSCGVSGAPTNPCHFPQDATQLTFDGTSNSPDTTPSWTSSTQALVSPAAATSGGGGAGGAGAGGAGNQPQTPAAGTASVGSVHVQGNTVGVTLTCGGPASSKCTESVQLVVVETLRGSQIIAIQAAKPKTRKRTVIVGTGSATLTGGQTTSLKLTLNKTGKALLAKYKTLHVGLKISQASGSSSHTVKVETLTLKLPQKHKK